MEKVAIGKKLVIGIIIVLLLNDILTTLSTTSLYALNGYLGKASQSLLQGIIRLIFTGIVLFFLYNGRNWAKWLMVILLAMGTLLSLVSLFSGFNLILLAMGMIYLGIVLALLFSSSIEEFFAHQKRTN